MNLIEYIKIKLIQKRNYYEIQIIDSYFYL